MSDVKKPAAVKMTREQAAKKRETAKAAVALLTDKYPEIFNLEDPKPLKIGIHQDLQADSGISKTQLRKALSAYTRHYNYIACLTKGGSRIDLKGENVAEVTVEEIQHASDKVAEIDKIKAERKEQQRVRKQRVIKQKDKEQRLASKLEALVTKKTN